MLVIAIAVLIKASGILAAACHDNGCVNTAIDNINAVYDEHLCKEIDKIDCRHHHEHHQELVCGTDGVTYTSHCLFAQARCFWVIYDAHHHGSSFSIDIASMGACPGFTSATTVAAPMTSMGTGVMTTVTDAQMTSTDEQSTAPYTGKPEASTASATLTVPTGSVTVTDGASSGTTHSVQDLMAKVFCDNRNNVDCSADFNVQCASNGKLYPNSCEMSKAACDDPAIHVVDIVQCIGDTHSAQLG